MSGFPKRFGFEIDMRGARVVATREPICSCCLADSEVDYQIQAMKENLDQVAKQMKSAIREQQKAPLFPGVPNA